MIKTLLKKMFPKLYGHLQEDIQYFGYLKRKYTPKRKIPNELCKAYYKKTGGG